MLEVIVRSSTKTSATHMTSSTFNALPKMIMTPKESRLVFVYYKLLDTFMCICRCSESGHFFLITCPVMKF